MTAQIDDLFRYNGTDFSVSGISEGDLFDPTLLGLKPAGTCSAIPFQSDKLKSFGLV